MLLSSLSIPSGTRPPSIGKPLAFVFLASILPGGAALAVTFQNVGPTPFGDDTHSASVSPFPPTPVSSIGGANPRQCPWINTRLNNFIAAHPANGTGPTGQGWSYSWAGVAQEA